MAGQIKINSKLNGTLGISNSTTTNIQVSNSTIAREAEENSKAVPQENATGVIGFSTLPYVQNPYPLEVGQDPSSKYSSKNSSAKYEGKYPENFLNFKLESISDILSLDINEYSTSFNFIVEFVDNDLREYWSSPDLVAQLRAELKAGNPYTTRKTIPVINFDFKFIKDYATKDQFKIPEDYAEVNITKTITTKEDVLKHINWMVSSVTSLRPAKEMGDWELELTEELGMDHSKELDALQSYLLSEESNISDNISDNSSDDSAGGILPIDGGFLGGEETIDETNLYPPFGVPGIRNRERRSLEGIRYIWLANARIWKNLTTD